MNKSFEERCYELYYKDREIDYSEEIEKEDKKIEGIIGNEEEGNNRDVFKADDLWLWDLNQKHT